MKELKILAIVVVIIGFLYWGVEPLAHSAMHPRSAPVDYSFRDLDKYGTIDYASGDIQRGRESFENNCSACHGLKSQGIESPMDADTAGSSFGVMPPDLSGIAYALDHKFLAHFIKDPVRATLMDFRFAVDCSYLQDEDAVSSCEQRNENKAEFPMPSASGLGLQDEDIADIVAYLVSIAPVSLSDKEVFLQSCNRCHGAGYDRGQYDNIFDSDSESKYGQPLSSATSAEHVSSYLGAVAPDLSMMIRSRGKKYLASLINNPQNVPLIDVKNAVLSGLLINARNEEKSSLDGLSEEQKEAKIKEIDLKTLDDYRIILPENTLRDSWQSDDDYTNIARHMGVMPIGKSMPRFGLNERAQSQVISYLEQVGDSKKLQREQLGIYMIGFIFVLSVFAYLWKLKIWRDLH